MRTLALLCLFAACTASTDGPTPAITSVAPMQLCDAQHAVMLTITGSGFSPIVAGALTSSPSVVMPKVTLIASGSSTEVPDADVTVPDASGTTLVITIPQGLVPPGVYDVEITNPDGHSTTLSAGLTIDPPPHITSIMPSSGAAGSKVTVTLMGTGFRIGMTVTLDATPPVTGTGVTVSNDGTTASATFDLTGVKPGTYDITVDNGDGCTDTLAGAFTVVTPHDLTITGIDPPFGCMCSQTPVTISGAGGFVSTPRVEMRPHGLTTPVTLMTRVAFVDGRTLTAVVPAGLALGNYDVTVINPPSDGGIGHLDNAFRVVSMPIPEIDAIVPSRGSPTANTAVSIYGANFRNPVKVELLDRTGAVAATVSSVAPVSATRIDTTLPTNGMTQDAYLVRVTDLDEMTYSTFSSFIVGAIGASGNLHAFTASGNLNTGRRMLAGVSARDDLGNTFVYAIGGDTGGATPMVLDTIEVAQLSKFGALGAWNAIRAPNTMTTARDAPAAVAVPLFDPLGSQFIPTKTYVYVLGGRNAAGTVLGSIERAMVLRNGDAPKITSSGPSATAGSLSTGTWYYKVSAVMSAADPDNPNGETLASDEAIVTLGAVGAIDLAWGAVTGAVKYRVYRTAMADGVSQQELLLAEVTGTTYSDTGGTATGVGPLPSGSLGVWTAQTQAIAARWGHQAAIVTDTTGARWVYALGGKSDATNGYLATVESAGVSSAGGLLAFGSTTTTALPTAMAFFSLAVETHENVASFTPATTGAARFVTTGGVAAGAASTEVTSSLVPDGGGNAAWAAYAGAGTIGTRAGPMSVITSDKLFCLGGAGTATDTAFTLIKATGDDVAFTAGAIGTPIQSTANAFPAGNPRALGAVITGSGFIYFVGGTSDGTNAVATTYQTF